MARTEQFQELVREPRDAGRGRRTRRTSRREDVPAERDRAGEGDLPPAARRPEEAGGKCSTRSSRASSASSSRRSACSSRPTSRRHGKTKVRDLVNEVSAKTGENIAVRRFARFQVGGGVGSLGRARRAGTRAAASCERGGRSRSTGASSSSSPARRWPASRATASTRPCSSGSPRRSARCTTLGVQVAIVIGGGNIFRGLQASASGMDRAVGRLHGHAGHRDQRPGAAEHAGEGRGCMTRVQSAIDMPAVAEPYIRRRAIRHLEKGRVVIFAAGTGQPLLHHRHRRGAARGRDRRRRDPQGHQGGRHLHGGSRCAIRTRPASPASPTSRS